MSLPILKTDARLGIICQHVHVDVRIEVDYILHVLSLGMSVLKKLSFPGGIVHVWIAGNREDSGRATGDGMLGILIV
jgi:hypothetical protein